MDQHPPTKRNIGNPTDGDLGIANMLASMPAGGGIGPSYQSFRKFTLHHAPLNQRVISSPNCAYLRNDAYLENGRIAADTVAALFQAADALFRAAPWKLAQDSRDAS